MISQSGGGIFKDGIPIYGDASSIASNKLKFDRVLLGTLAGASLMRQNLIEAGIDDSKIDSSFVSSSITARIQFLNDFAVLYGNPGADVAVAEGGVFQGEFAKEINRVFPNQRFHLFDTFSGFDSRDIDIESQKGYSSQKAGHFNITGEELVLGKLPHKDRAIVHKGYFPESTKGIAEEKYLFVSLDFDLYRPTLKGLNYFYPRMIKGGCILIDDYFGTGYRGIAEAVREYEHENGILHKGPIGDHSGLAIYI